MISVELYLRAFVRVMPRRAKVLISLLKIKRKADSKILSSNFTNQARIKEWKKIVGKNTLFRSAEKRNKQSLRHYLWKTQKSLNMFKTLRKRVEELRSENAFAGSYSIVYGNLVKVLDCGEQEKTLLAQVDESLIRQIEAIDQKDYEKFRREFDIQKRIGGYFPQIAEIIQRNSRTFIPLMKRLKREMGKGGVFGPLGPVMVGCVAGAAALMVVLVGGLLVGFIGGIAMLGFGFEEYLKEFLKILGYVGGGILAFGGIAFVGGPIASGGIIVTRTIKSIIEFVRETV